MKSFKEYIAEAKGDLSTTEKALLDKYNENKKMYGHTHIPIQGKREHDAAKKLVAKGHAKEYKNMSGLSKGEYKISPFTRKAYTTKDLFVYGGELVFEPTVGDITSEFINRYKDDPKGVYNQAKAAYLDAVSAAKSHSVKAAELHKSHETMSKIEFQNSVMKHFGKHLKKYGFPKHASKGWGDAEHDLLKELSK